MACLRVRVVQVVGEMGFLTTQGQRERQTKAEPVAMDLVVEIHGQVLAVVALTQPEQMEL